MQSIWENTPEEFRFSSPENDLKTDVLIIGGGMCGVLCAYLLDRAGIDYALVEADTICSGITKKTTAKITLQHGLIYDRLIRDFGIEQAKQYFDVNEAAVKKYRELCREIDCDFEEKAAYVYSINGRTKLEKEFDALQKLGCSTELMNTLPLPFPVAGGIKLPGQAQFHPLKFVNGICGKLNIFEHTRVLQLIGTTAVTNHGKIFAKRIIIATHFPFLNKHGSYFIKLYQHRSYVIALSDCPTIDGMYVDEAQNGMSFRSYQNWLLIGGGDHRTGKKGGGWQALRDFANRYYPKATEVCHWATQDCMTLDGVPYIGPYSATTNGLYVATGFNKWGMTSSMVAAMMLGDMMQGKDHPSMQVFSPSRSIIHPQLLVNAFESITGLLTPSTKRCPHMGCALKWNRDERTWDCPCHGSRFTQDGRIIDNPAIDDIKK